MLKMSCWSSTCCAFILTRSTPLQHWVGINEVAPLPSIQPKNCSCLNNPKLRIKSWTQMKAKPTTQKRLDRVTIFLFFIHTELWQKHTLTLTLLDTPWQQFVCVCPCFCLLWSHLSNSSTSPWGCQQISKNPEGINTHTHMKQIHKSTAKHFARPIYTINIKGGLGLVMRWARLRERDKLMDSDRNMTARIFFL